MGCKLIGYRRVSTAKQGESGLGLEAQETAIKAHVERSGCNLVASYTEVETGKRADRPELVKAIAHAKRIGATLVIAKLDRLARNVAFVAGLMESGVEFVACDNPNANRLTVHILAAVAEDEARQISSRTKAALNAARARGTKLGGVRAGQHRLTSEDRAKGREKAGTGKRTQAVEAYAHLVPAMLEWKAGGLSLAKIADRLNGEGHTTRTGVAWTPVQVHRALERANP